MAGCGGEVSTLDPSGPAAEAIATMWSVMLVGATLITLLVMVLLALGFRAQAGRAPQALWLGGGAVGFVSVVLVALLAYAFVVGERLRPLTGPEAVTLRATAEQWRWRFAYGPARGATEGVLVIPAGRAVTLEVTATDVIHSFWVPRLAGKIDAIPGHVSRLRLQADRPGRYAGLCAEFCGIGHRTHNFTVVALARAEWEDFLAGAPPPPDQEARGDD